MIAARRSATGPAYDSTVTDRGDSIALTRGSTSGGPAPVRPKGQARRARRAAETETAPALTARLHPGDSASRRTTLAMRGGLLSGGCGSSQVTGGDCDAACGMTWLW